MADIELDWKDGEQGACWACRRLYYDEKEGGYHCFHDREHVCLRDECNCDRHLCHFDPPRFVGIKDDDEPVMIRGNDGRIRNGL